MLRFSRVVILLIFSLLWTPTLQARSVRSKSSEPHFLTYQELYNLPPKIRVQYIREIRLALADMERSIRKSERPSKKSLSLIESLRKALTVFGPIEEAEAHPQCTGGSRWSSSQGVCAKAPGPSGNCGPGFRAFSSDSGVSCVQVSTMNSHARAEMGLAPTTAGPKFAAVKAQAPVSSTKGAAPTGTNPNQASVLAAQNQLSAAAGQQQKQQEQLKAAAQQQQQQQQKAAAAAAAPSAASNPAQASQPVTQINNYYTTAPAPAPPPVPSGITLPAPASAQQNAERTAAANQCRAAAPSGTTPSTAAPPAAPAANSACLFAGNISSYNGAATVGNCKKVDKYPQTASTSEPPAMSCSDGKVICNPILYCGEKVGNDLKPFCEDATGDVTSSCERDAAAKAPDCDPNAAKYSSIPAVQDEWNGFKAKFDSLCAAGSALATANCEDCAMLKARVDKAFPAAAVPNAPQPTGQPAPNVQTAPTGIVPR